MQNTDRRGRISLYVFCGFAAIAGFYLVLEHQAHLWGALPYLLLLACPLMHVFMHRGGHGGHRHDSGTSHIGRATRTDDGSPP